MKLLAILSVSMPLLAFGGESYFFTLAGKPTGQSIEGNNLHIVLPIQKLDPPSASSLVAFHQGLGPGREYQIQVNLKSIPEKEWMPMLSLGGDLITDGVSVSRPDNPRFAASFSLENDDPEKIKLWCQLLRDLLKLPADQVEIDLSKSESGTGQPVRGPKPDSGGSNEPQPAPESGSQ